MTDRFVVAEVSKNWVRGEPFLPETKLLAQSFEEIINHWDKRGYRLHSFTLDRAATGDEMNETIIAVFEAQAEAAGINDASDASLEENHPGPSR